MHFIWLYKCFYAWFMTRYQTDWNCHECLFKIDALWFPNRYHPVLLHVKINVDLQNQCIPNLGEMLYDRFTMYQFNMFPNTIVLIWYNMFFITFRKSCDICLATNKHCAIYGSLVCWSFCWYVFRTKVQFLTLCIWETPKRVLLQLVKTRWIAARYSDKWI